MKKKRISFFVMRSILRKILSLGLILMLPAFSFSQGEFNNWYFGNYAEVTFNSGVPVFLTNGMYSYSGFSVSVSDSTGFFLFSSESGEVFNRNQEVMPNGYDLHGVISGFLQTSFVVQSIESNNLYYLFTTDLGGYGLEYSIINMELDGGLGDIEPGQKCIPLPGMIKAIGAVTGTRHKNNKDAWVVAKISDNFVATVCSRFCYKIFFPIFS